MSARSVPDELVEAAAEALRNYYGETNGSDAFHAAANREAARAALQAAFAKLPECEAAANVVEDVFEADHYDIDEAARAVLAALAREFGDGEASRG